MNNISLFLDRDGTINYEVDYLSSLTDIKLIPGSMEAIKEAKMLGWMVFVVTNQSGIARGILTEEKLSEIHNALQSELRKDHVSIDAFYYCPHHPDIGQSRYRKKCMCRKPDIGMLKQAQNDFNVDMTKSFFIGDKMIDIQTGNNCNIKSILVLTGYGNDEYKLCIANNVKIDYVANNLYDAVQYVKRTEITDQLVSN